MAQYSDGEAWSEIPLGDEIRALVVLNLQS